MIDLKDTDQLLREHRMRADRVNREAWKWEEPDHPGGPRHRRISIGVAALRQHAGMAVVRAGYRLLPANPHPGARS